METHSASSGGPQQQPEGSKRPKQITTGSEEDVHDAGECGSCKHASDCVLLVWCFAAKRIGEGPVWSLKRACSESMARTPLDAVMHPVHKGLLRQALKSDQVSTDLKIVFEDESASVRAHSGQLKLRSKYFDTLFGDSQSTWIEKQQRVLTLPSSTTAQAFKGLLEWIYLGE
jgi:hypothetical protein